jgi:hypothetical protein
MIVPVLGARAGEVAPVFVWPVSPGSQPAGLGMGELLLVTTFAIVLTYGFGRPASPVAWLVSLSTLRLLVALPAAEVLGATFSAIVVVGLLIVAQFVIWLRRRGGEARTDSCAAGIQTWTNRDWPEGFPNYGEIQ